MKNKKKLIPIAAIVIMGLVFMAVLKNSKEPLSVNTILRYTPENTVLATGILFLLFALKSLTVVFPLSILYLTSGIIFRPIAAVLVSTIGLAITITIPFWIGKESGKQVVQKACDTPYRIYLTAGVTGSLLSIITTTWLGEKISDPFSVEFMIVLMCRILVSMGAIVINHRLNQKKK